MNKHLQRIYDFLSVLLFVPIPMDEKSTTNAIFQLRQHESIARTYRNELNLDSCFMSLLGASIMLLCIMKVRKATQKRKIYYFCKSNPHLQLHVKRTSNFVTKKIFPVMQNQFKKSCVFRHSFEKIYKFRNFVFHAYEQYHLSYSTQQRVNTHKTATHTFAILLT